MNNKTLITIIVVLIIVVAVIVVGGKLGKKATAPEESSTTMQNQQEVQQPQAGKVTTINNEKIITITATNSGFDPKTITIKTGTRVIWTSTNDGPVAIASADHPTHRVYPPLNLGSFAKGSSVQLVFDKPGTYKYHDHLNPNRTGTVVVE